MSKRFATVLVAAVIVLALAVAKRHELVRVLLQGTAGLAGYRLRIAEFHIGWRSAEFAGVEAQRGREPLLDVRRVVVRYSPRDLLPGSRHRFGLTAIEVDRPRLTLIRFKDGSFNVGIPSGGAPPAAPLRVDPIPIRFTLHVADAQIDLREPGAYEASAKRLRVDGIAVDGSIDTADSNALYRPRCVRIEPARAVHDRGTHRCDCGVCDPSRSRARTSRRARSQTTAPTPPRCGCWAAKRATSTQSSMRST